MHKARISDIGFWLIRQSVRFFLSIPDDFFSDKANFEHSGNLAAKIAERCSSPRLCATNSPDLFERNPKGEGPRGHAKPAGQESLVEAEKALVI